MDVKDNVFVVMTTVLVAMDILSLPSEVGARRMYSGDKVLQVDVPSLSHWKAVQHILDNKIDPENVDIWRDPDLTHKSTDIYVTQHQFPILVNHLNSGGFQFKVIIHDVGNLVASHMHTLRRRKRDAQGPKSIVGRYARYQEILNWMDEIANTYPELATVFSIGQTYEGRSQYVLKLGIPRGAKWGVWLDSAMHAREWVAPTTTIYIIHQLISGYKDRNPEIISFLENMDWYFMPVVNVDGYEYCHTTERLWRKNRHPIEGTNCTGVDLNRNWGFQWGGANAQTDACGVMYRGEEPESEPEVQNIINFLYPRREGFLAYISLHAYGQKCLTRWAYKELYPRDNDILYDLLKRATDAINAVWNNSYQAGTAAELMYPYSGGSGDWAKGTANITYSYLFELRDKADGHYSFILPEEQILPTGQEFWAGFKVMAQEFVDKYAQVLPPFSEDDEDYPDDDSDDAGYSNSNYEYSNEDDSEDVSDNFSGDSNSDNELEESNKQKKKSRMVILPRTGARRQRKGSGSQRINTSTHVLTLTLFLSLGVCKLLLLG